MNYLILYVLAAVLLVLSAVKDRQKTKKALKKSLKALDNILPQFLTVLFIVAAVLAVFDPDFISRFIGEKSGLFGGVIAAVIGSITLIPGFVAFPAAAELMQNGAGVFQVAAFVSALMMVGVVTLPMEISCFGRRAAVIRNVLAFLFSIAVGFFVSWAVTLWK